jgi:hypothetical protein
MNAASMSDRATLRRPVQPRNHKETRGPTEDTWAAANER